MKKIILLSAIFILSSCGYLLKGKYHEELQYYGLNEKFKPKIKKDEIYITRVTRIETLNETIADINSKYKGNSRPVGSWDFSQRPNKELKDEITDKAVEFGANHIVMLEKKGCEKMELKEDKIDAKSGYSCYHILYYYLPTKTNIEIPTPKPETKSTSDSDIAK